MDLDEGHLLRELEYFSDTIFMEVGWYWVDDFLFLLLFFSLKRGMNCFSLADVSPEGLTLGFCFSKKEEEVTELVRLRI